MKIKKLCTVLSVVLSLLLSTNNAVSCAMESNNAMHNTSTGDNTIHSEQTNNNEEDITADELIKIVNEIEANFPDNIEHVEPILTLGRTGAGKTTTALYLSREKLIRKGSSSQEDQKYQKYRKKKIESCTKEGGNDPNTVFEVESKNKRGLIGHKKSTTLFPSFYKLDRGLTICDCAGFFDDRGVEHRLGIVVTTRLMVEKSRGIRAVFYITEEKELKWPQSRDEFNEILDNFGKMFDDPSQHVKSIFFGVTKRDKWETIEDCFFALEERKLMYFKSLSDKYKLTESNRDALNEAKSIHDVIQVLKKGNEHAKKNMSQQEQKDQNEVETKADSPPKDMEKGPEPSDEQKEEVRWIKRYAFLNAMQDYNESNVFFINPLQPELIDGILDRFKKSPIIDKKSFKGTGDIMTLSFADKIFLGEARKGIELLSKMKTCRIGLKNHGIILREHQRRKNNTNAKVTLSEKCKEAVDGYKKKIAEIKSYLSSHDNSDTTQVKGYTVGHRVAYEDMYWYDKMLCCCCVYLDTGIKPSPYACTHYLLTKLDSNEQASHLVKTDYLKFKKSDGTFAKGSYIWTYYPGPDTDCTVRIFAEKRYVYEDEIASKKTEKAQYEKFVKDAIDGDQKDIQKAFDNLKKEDKEHKSTFKHKRPFFDLMLSLSSWLAEDKGPIQCFLDTYESSFSFKPENSGKGDDEEKKQNEQ